jgi:hypothetical protein
MKYELKRISVWSVIKVSFLVNLVVGFLMGILYAFFIMIFAFLPMTFMPSEVRSEVPIAASGILLIIVPIFVAGMAAIFNTIFAAIAALVYNLAAKLVGGLEWTLEEVKPAVVLQPATRTAPPPEPPSPPPPQSIEPNE